MSRLIDTESEGKQRNQLTKSILICIREFMKQSSADQKSKDLTAFIILALRDIHSGIDPTVEAWEKRGYWVKADRFRMEWRWTESYAKELEVALMKDDWGTVAQTAIRIAEKFPNVKVPTRRMSGDFWDRAYCRLTKPA
ncbi:MAG: hypothetical protein ABFD14_13855 [Anaerolineaceae bacterium]